MKELLKFGKDGVVDVLHHLSDNESNVHVLCGSLVERYKRQEMGFHIHLQSRSFGTIDDGKRPDLCLLIERGSEVDVSPCLPVDILGNQIIRRDASVEVSVQYPSVLVDVAEIINDSQHILAGVLPMTVRLQPLNLCNGIDRYAVEPPALALRDERFWCCADREHVAVAGVLIRSKYKFPYQIIEGGTQILETVPDNNRQAGRDRLVGDNLPDVLIRCTFRLSHHFCWVRFVIPSELGFELLKVLISPDDFVQDCVGNRHDLASPQGVELLI